MLVVVLTHVAEAIRVWPSMRWGQADSPGPYLDLTDEVLAVTLLPIGSLIHWRASKARSR